MYHFGPLPLSIAFRGIITAPKGGGFLFHGAIDSAPLREWRQARPLRPGPTGPVKFKIMEGMSMKQVNKMSRAISTIEGIYNSTNADFWGGALPPVIVTCQSSPGTFGHSTVSRVWKRKEDDLFELNIACEVLDYPIEEILDTVIHEQVHIFCRVNNIQEVSRHGSYHNKTFRKLAEEHGLECVYTGSTHGWNTEAKDNDRLLAYALEKGYTELQISRRSRGPKMLGTPGGRKAPGEKRPSSTRKLVCPGGCGQTVRATKKVQVICGLCFVPMIEAE